MQFGPLVVVIDRFITFNDIKLISVYIYIQSTFGIYKTRRYFNILEFLTLRYFFRLFIFSIALLLWPIVIHAKDLRVAIIETEQLEESSRQINQQFKDELVALLEGDYVVHFEPYIIKQNTQLSHIDALLDEAYQDPKNDMVLVLDVAANQIVGLRPNFPKPTFLPIVFNAELVGYPSTGEASGKKNLHYLTERLNFVEELNTLKTIAPFSRAVLIGDAAIGKSVGVTMLEGAQKQARNAAVDLTFLWYEGDVKKLISAIPADVDAALLGFMPKATNEAVQYLIDEMNKRRILSFSIVGDEFVKKGALASNTPDTNFRTLARRNALNMQAVLLGDKAENLPVFFKNSNRLMINMETARKIHYAPRFDVLSDAILINEDHRVDGVVYSLEDVAYRAVAVNLSLAAQRMQKERAGERVNEARGALLPQINSSFGHTQRKNTQSVRRGFQAKDTTDGAIQLSQTIYSERKWANYAIQKYEALSEEELLRQTELDIVQAAVNAYLDVLRAQTTLAQERYNLNITRQNLNLAENRVQVGSADASDLYRWQSELANSKSRVLTSKATLEQTRQTLNRLLDRPITENFSTSVETLDNPALLISNEEIRDMIDNAYALETLTDTFVQQGLRLSPELKQLGAQIASATRQHTRDKRLYWIPDVNLTGQYSSNLDENRVTGGIPAAKNDWQVGVELSLPLFEGGARYARTAQSRLAVHQLELERRNIRNTIETNIRSAMEATNASYGIIDLAKKSENASKKNYDLVSQSYAQGQVSIVTLLDSQSALLSAREAAMNAVHQFLIDLINLQRSRGIFDFFLTDEQKMDFSGELKTRINEEMRSNNMNVK